MIFCLMTFQINDENEILLLHAQKLSGAAHLIEVFHSLEDSFSPPSRMRFTQQIDGMTDRQTCCPFQASICACLCFSSLWKIISNVLFHYGLMGTTTTMPDRQGNILTLHSHYLHFRFSHSI
jgi:hypothetical protein